MAAQEEKASGEEQDFPRNWVWEEDGKDLGDRWRLSEGRYVSAGRGRTSRGKRGVLILEVDGEERTVWLFHSPLLDKIREELEDRGERELVVGERLTIDRYKEMQTSQSTGQPYVPYRVRFHDSPEQSLWDVLGGSKASADTTVDPESDENVGDDAGQDGDDIPF